tara:strand:- start:128 stop:586 length:459 start_codon:yes stop_codon:yes gene_type:complete
MDNLNKHNLNRIELVTEKNNGKYFIIDNNSNKTTIYIGDKNNKNNKKLNKSNKKRRYKNKTIKGGNNKNKTIKGGNNKNEYITDKLDQDLIVHDDEDDKYDVIKSNEKLSNKEISIIKGYKHQDNGSIAYLCKDDNNAFFFVQGEKTIDLSV